MGVWEIVPVHPVLVTLVGVAASVWCAIWVIAYVTCGVCKSRARLDGKTVILTGCTSGIGKATAFDLARRGARLIMACRNLDKANAVREIIVEATKNENVVVRQVDVGDLSSVRKFAAEINNSETRLDVLIHNAGLLIGDHTTEDGINMVWATNHFGPFLLTHLLIDLLKKTGRARVIYLSSILHYFGGVSLKNPNPLKEKVIGAFYFMTKFANVLVANELARRLEGSGVTANSVHPGAVNTPICEQAPLWWMFFALLFTPMQKTVEQGAQTTIYLAVSDEVEGVSGKYFTDCKEWSPARKTRDVDFAKKYWKLSEDIVHLKPSDPHI